MILSHVLTVCVHYRFIDNVASTDGGGAVYVYDFQSMTVSDTMFRGNAAGTGGGALETVRVDVS